jgi:hypothetical protein
MKLKHALIVITLALIVCGLSAQDNLAQLPNMSTGIGLHAGTLSGSGYSMRFMGEKHGLQVTLGALTYGSDNVYFPSRYYYWDGDYYEYGYVMPVGIDGNGEDDVPEDTLITYEAIGRTTTANIGLNYIYTLDKFNVLGHKDYGRLYVMAGGSYSYHNQKVHTKDYELVVEEPDSTYNYWNWYYDPIDGTEDVTTNIEHHWTVGAGLGAEIALGKQFRVALELPITYNWENRIIMYIPQIGIYYYFK